MPPRVIAGGTARRGPRGLRSLRTRIVLPVVLAAVALVVLGLVQTDESVAEARAAAQAMVLARLSSRAAVLVHHVELEYSETNALRQRGGEAGAQLLTAAQARTDAAHARYTAAAKDIKDASANLDQALRNANRALDLLSAVRNLAPGSTDGSVEIVDVYNQISEDLIAVADAAPTQISDPDLVAIARSVAVVAALEHLAAEQLDLLRRLFTRQRLSPGELVRLAGWAGGEQEKRGELWRLSGPAKDLYKELVSGPDVKQAVELRDAVLAADGARKTLNTDPDVWYAAQSGVLRRLRVLEVTLTSIVEQRATDIQQTARTRSAAIAGLTLAVIVSTLLGAHLLAVRTSRRLRRVRQSALTVAHDELPDAVAQVATAGDAPAIRAAMRASEDRIAAMMAAGSDDEIGELGHAFGDVHRQALRLAADQALLRMEVEAIFVALSRRGQTLAQRQLRLIDQFGTAESDPQRLSRLYAIDHLAARMRRNEENLLVLAGGEPGRRFLTPVPVHDVIVASVEEVEDHARIEVAEAPGVAIVAHAVGDVIHLLAELLENATNFSPPSTTVRVAARRTVQDVHVTVFDEGIGMPPEKVVEANRRLTQRAELTSNLVGTMGLLVVSRLAGRHGIRVQVSSTPAGGTAATVTIPEPLLAPEPPTDHLRRARWRGVDLRAETDQPELDRPYGGWPPPGASSTPARHSVPTQRAPRPAQPATGSASVYSSATAGAGTTHGHGAESAHAVQDAAPAGYTAAGLPRRVVQGTPMPTYPKPNTTGTHPAAGPPDPDAARARLSSLASGIAAAQRRTSSAPPNQPS